MAADLDVISRFFQISWILITLSGVFPFFLARERLKEQKTAIMKVVAGFIVLGLFGLLAEWSWTNNMIKLTPEEFSISVGFISALASIYLVGNAQKHLQAEVTQVFNIRASKITLAFKKTFERVRGKISLSESPFVFSARVTGSYSLEYQFFVEIKESFTTEHNKNNIINNKKKSLQSKVSLKNIPTGKTITISQLLFFLTTIPPIISRAYQSFDLYLDQNVINAQVAFFVLFLSLNLFFILESSTQVSQLLLVHQS